MDVFQVNNISTETEAANEGVPWKNLFLEILQYSQENICVGVSF